MNNNFPTLSSCPFCGNDLTGGNSFTIRTNERIYFCSQCKIPEKIVEKNGRKIRVPSKQGINVMLNVEGEIRPKIEELATLPPIEKKRKIKPIGSRRKRR